jgi:TonB-dependent receptor
MEGRRNDVGWCAAVAAALICFTLLLVGGTAAAATKDGIIRGHVTDTKSVALSGVVVVLRPGDLTFVTDRQGFFVATALDPGTYTVEIVAIGFTTVTQEVQVKAGVETNIEAKLQPATRIAETVTVTATRIHGELDALNERATAPDILNVIPLELIQSLPNANVADAAGRLPSVSLERDQGEGKYVQVRGLEPRFTSLQVNGNVMPSSDFNSRQAKLDAVPSDLVDEIELHKTASADLDGDMIGGSVNLLSKTAGELPYFTVKVMGGYNSMQDARNKPYEANAMYTQRFGKEKALGLVVSGSYDHNTKGIWDNEPTAETVELPDGSKTNVFTTLYPRDYLFDRTRWGMNAGLDYRLGTTGSLYLRGFYSNFANDVVKYETKISAGDFITPTLTEANGKYKTKTVDERANETNWNLSFGGAHTLAEKAFLDYNVAYSSAPNTQHNDKYDEDGPKKIAFQVNNNQNFPSLTPLNLTFDPYDPSRWEVADAEYDNEKTTARDAVARLNVGFPYESGTFKVGAKYRDEKKTSKLNDTYWTATGDPALTIDQALNHFKDAHFYFGHYTEGPNLDIATANKFFHDHPEAFEEDFNSEHTNNDAEHFAASEKIAALYAMNTNTFGQLEIAEGVRVERTKAHYDGFQLTFDVDGNWVSTAPVSGGSTYTNVLPSVSLKYAMGPHTNLRAVYAWGISRPEFVLLVPTFDIGYNGNIPVITKGNPSLKPTKATSYDVLFEHFFGSVGLVSAGVFYKDLTDPIYPGSGTIIHGGIYDGYQQVQPINGPKANVYGFEVAYQQHLSSLPGLLSGLGIDLNYSYTKSKATFDPTTGRTGTAELQRTVPNIANVGLTYDKGGFSFRVAAQYNDAYIFLYGYFDGNEGGLHGPLGDTYAYPHTEIDAQASYTFKNGLEIILSGQNLNNEVFGFYNGSPHWNIQREFYDRTYSLGFKFTR